jgi:tetratricopeptide (TPR) repeat protein
VAEVAIADAVGDHPELLILAVAYQANAQRVDGDRARAETTFARARRLMNHYRVKDLQTKADLDQLYASLLIDLRRFAEAEELLAGAALNYGVLEHEEAMARTLMKLSNAYAYSGRLADAIETDHAVIAIIDRQEHPRLYAFARLNLSSNLSAAGEHLAARDLLTFDADLYERYADASTMASVRWLEGRIAQALGDAWEAEQAYLAARTVFSERGNGFDVASVSLNLALLYREQGRYAELMEIAASAVTLFEAQAVHRDALAALVMLRDAVAARTASTGTIRRIAEYFEKLGRNPAGQFEQPS